jgi:ribose 5-phosphate isomerase B
MGIVVGMSGQGEAMAANRVKGVRCTLFYGPVAPRQAINIEGDKSDDPYEILRLSREHNLANMLSFAARFLSWEEIEKAVTTWLETPHDKAERHVRRAQKLDR